MKRTGIYMIENIVNGRFYIGATVKSLSDRWIEHRSVLRRGKHRNHLLQDDWAAYGENAFIFRVLEELPVHQVMNREQELINELYDKGVSCYNLSAFAISGGGHKHAISAPRPHRQVTKKRGVFLDLDSCPELYDGLMVCAARYGVSKAEMVRRFIALELSQSEQN